MRLLLGYASGIFPWYNENQPILWFSPQRRFVLFSRRLHVGRSLGKRIRRGDYEIRMDTAFADVIRRCRGKRRPGQRGTWITDDMERAYIDLHELGYAHSVEAWSEGRLVGGLYGVSMGRFYSGESMFADAPDASKTAFVWLVRQLRAWNFPMVDCQVRTDHLARFGAEEVPRARYLEIVTDLLRAETRSGPWTFDPGFDPIEEPAEE